MSAWDEREEDLEAQLNRGALWAVTYGDLMSYLVIFFLLMYATSVTRSLDLQLGLKTIEEQFGSRGKVAAQIFSRHGIQQIAKLELGESRIRIVFLSPVLFDSGEAVLKSEAMPHLQRLAVALEDLPNPIQIEGHTDDTPLGARSAFKTNWELSAARAFAVLRFFEVSGVPPHRLSATGYGEFRPVKPNGTAQGRSANRRIEVNIMRRED